MTTQIADISTEVTSVWATLGTLENWISFVPFVTTMQTVVWSIVLTGFFNGWFQGAELVYGGIACMLTMLYVAAGYEVVKAIAAGVDFANGYYFQYAGASTFADRMAIYEFVLLGGYIFWGLFQAVFGTYVASEAWSQTEARVAEADASATGLQTTMRWDLAIKSVTLMMLVGFVHSLVAYSLGVEAGPVVGWFDEYSNDTTKEGQDKETFKYDPDGTSAEEDILYHLITGIASMFALGCSNLGSYIFMLSFLNINGDDGFQCDLDGVNASQYSGVQNLLKDSTTYEKCMANVVQIFDMADKDSNGEISRCENAKLQYASGSTKEYALKYSSPYTRASVLQFCNAKF